MGQTGGHKDLTPVEGEFIEDVSHGILRPELLFPDSPEDADRISGHPAILWKIANAQEHEARKHR